MSSSISGSGVLLAKREGIGALIADAVTVAPGAAAVSRDADRPLKKSEYDLPAGTPSCPVRFILIGPAAGLVPIEDTAALTGRVFGILVGMLASFDESEPSSELCFVIASIAAVAAAAVLECDVQAQPARCLPRDGMQTN
jgi:hypothetical protein